MSRVLATKGRIVLFCMPERGEYNEKEIWPAVVLDNPNKDNTCTLKVLTGDGDLVFRGIREDHEVSIQYETDIRQGRWAWPPGVTDSVRE